MTDKESTVFKLASLNYTSEDYKNTPTQNNIKVSLTRKLTTIKVIILMSSNQYFYRKIMSRVL